MRRLRKKKQRNAPSKKERMKERLYFKADMDRSNTLTYGHARSPTSVLEWLPELAGGGRRRGARCGVAGGGRGENWRGREEISQWSLSNRKILEWDPQNYPYFNGS